MLNITFERFSQIPQKYSLIENFLYDKTVADEDTIYYVKLAVYELAGNILKHSKSKANLVLMCEGDIIRIYLSGSNSFELKKISLPPKTCECGRGIYLVKKISETMEYYNGGKDVCVCIKCKHKID